MEQKFTSSPAVKSKSPINAILLISLLVGTLDALAAVIIYKADPVKLFQFIAGGAFGMKDAFAGGTPMALYGIFFHYLIAFCWTVLFFYIYPKIHVLSCNKIITGVAYGMVVWIIMNLVVLPLSKIPNSEFDFMKAGLGMLIVIFMVGLPIVVLTARYFAKR